MSFVYRPRGDGSGVPPKGPAWIGPFRSVIKYWALAGGVVLLALVLITAGSATSNLLFNVPFAGEYELAKHFVGIAIFTFLPYCQLTGGNVTVDIFTEGMGQRAKSAMLAASSLLAAALSVLLFRQMAYGFVDYVRYPEETATLHLPLWTAFPPILLSLALLLIASVITAHDAWRGMRDIGSPAGPSRPE